ncbi:spore photoproduct lyase family protein [Microlunatus flavus]|uniref:Spore photoproduct lyase n=1 Tax=Microlunatus flavus TaxID=1036181 RepID=A0A1H9F6E1_9ACTN|nr:radical SAM protein [Microlunatus flavus]SEQ32838.1 spore photoproduct lyase [Microlunatus flavus]
MISAPSTPASVDPAPATPAPAEPGPGSPRVRRWTPRRVLVTKAAVGLPHTDEVLRRAAQAGVEEVETVGRIVPPRTANEREAYAWAKSTLAVVVAPPSARKPQPIPPSADWRIDLARGCPAHCQYCYLAGSLTGPPITRVYANLDEVLAPIAGLTGQGHVTSGTAARGHEGTTFELSCYTDPLGIEHVTGSLAAAVAQVGTGVHGDGASLRFTTKFDDVAELAALPHGGRTRARFSVNAAEVAARFDGGTAPVPARLRALATLAAAGYPVGLTIAPVMPVEGWRETYGQLLDDVRAVLAPVEAAGHPVDLTVEVITHRFTPGSRDVLMSWYPRTKLEMDVDARRAKRSKFGGVKYVYPTETMRALRSWFEAEVPARLPGTPLLYLT